MLGSGRVAAKAGGWVVCLLVVLVGRPARAQAAEDEGGVPLAWSVGSGCALALASMAVGGGISGGSEGERARRTGIEILVGGLALAPTVSHLIAGEWKRAAVFGGASLSLAIFTTVLVEESTAVLDGGEKTSRIPFGIAIAAQVAVSTAGLIDSLMAGERARRRQALAVMPLLGSKTLGLSLGGLL